MARTQGFKPRSAQETKVIDLEVAALMAIADALAPLTQESRDRVLKYFADRYREQQ